MSFTTFNDMLRRAANCFPDKVFLHWVDENRDLSFREADWISDRAAGALTALGVEKGDRVGIFASNSLNYQMAMFGTWKAGAISCHINILQAEDLVYFVRNSAPRVLLYSHEMTPYVEANRSRMNSIEHYISLDGEGVGNEREDWTALLERARETPAMAVTGDDPAHLSYTSGSSGMPKGALLKHGSTARASHCIAERLRISSADSTLGPTSPASSYGLVANILPALHCGATVGIMTRWDVEKAWDEMEKRGITLFPANPLIFADFLEECRKRGRRPSRLRAAPSGGAPVPLDLKKAFLEELDVILVESYGQSELGGFVALGFPRKEAGEHLAAIGPALPDKEVRVMDESEREVPVGEPGEMCIRGGFMAGYWEMPEKTAATIRNGWLHTGDMGRMDAEGYLTMLGRWSERIVSDGRVIFPRPMEESLLRHPAVQYAAVIGKPDSKRGEISKAIVSLFPGKRATSEALLAHCRKELGPEDSPSLLEIIDSMPMTPTGKIGRAELQRREREGGKRKKED